jgi:GNAT superfamily N-acetyltransferase
MTVRITFLSNQYIGEAYQLIQNEGWTVSEQDFRTLLAFNGTHAFMILIREKVIGMIVVIGYDTFGFLGNLIIAPSFRHKGYGTQLLQKAIASLSEMNISMIMLDAVPQAVPLYQRLGFQSICKSLRFRGELFHEEIVHPLNFTEKMTSGNFADVVSLDRQIFGADRSGLLKTQFKLFPQFCHTIYRNGKISGYIMATPYRNLLKIGPWICTEHESTPEILLQQVSSITPTSDIYLGILEQNTQSVDIMHHFNLPLQFHSIRMIFGGDHLPHSSGMFAIGGPDRG